MTPEEWAADFQKKLDIIKTGDFVFLAAKSSMAAMSKRIFADGKNTGGGSIGSYNSTNELYVSDDNSPKAGSHKGKTGKTITTTYYTSYKNFRDKMNRNTSVVNLKLNNELQNDFNNSAISKGDNALGKSIPIKVNNFHYQIVLNKDINIAKKTGAEKKYGKIFDLTKREEQIFLQVQEFEIAKIL